MRQGCGWLGRTGGWHVCGPRFNSWHCNDPQLSAVVLVPRPKTTRHNTMITTMGHNKSQNHDATEEKVFGAWRDRTVVKCLPFMWLIPPPSPAHTRSPCTEPRVSPAHRWVSPPKQNNNNKNPHKSKNMFTTYSFTFLCGYVNL